MTMTPRSLHCSNEMIGNETPDQLILASRLSEMERLPPWIDALATKFGIADHARFAIQLCLEEVVSNVIRHGYADQDGHFITIHCAEPQPRYVVFTVDDDAPPFNPLELDPLPAIGEQDLGAFGGQGIRLLRGFAATLEYEPKAGGNRLHIGFSNASSVIAKSL